MDGWDTDQIRTTKNEDDQKTQKTRGIFQTISDMLERAMQVYITESKVNGCSYTMTRMASQEISVFLPALIGPSASLA